MTTTNLYVQASADDQDDSGDPIANPLMRTEWMNAVTPPSICTCWFDITPSLTGETILGIDMHWFQHASAKSKGVDYHHTIFLNGHLVFNQTGYSASYQWKTAAVPAGSLQYFNVDSLNRFEFVVPDPGGTYYRRWTMRTYDYDAGHTYAPYIVVEHTTAVAGTSTFTPIIFVG